MMMRYVALPTLLLAACGGAQELVLADGQNYSYTGEMTIPSISTASAQGVEICWDKLVQDLQCHDTSPVADIDLLSLIRFPDLSQAEVEEGISNDTLTQSQLDGYVSLEVGDETCGNLEDFSLLGTPVDISKEYFDGGGTYLLMIASGDTPGQGARMLTFMEPLADNTTDAVSVGDGCDLLDFQADLVSKNVVTMNAAGPWTVNWSGLTRNGIGNPMDPARIDGLEVGYYADLTVEQIQDQFLDLELIADDWYSADLPPGSTADLSLVRNAAGASLDALTTDGVWLLALRCSTCSNPAPLFLGVIEVVE